MEPLTTTVRIVFLLEIIAGNLSKPFPALGDATTRAEDDAPV